MCPYVGHISLFFLSRITFHIAGIEIQVSDGYSSLTI